MLLKNLALAAFITMSTVAPVKAEVGVKSGIDIIKGTSSHGVQVIAKKICHKHGKFIKCKKIGHRRHRRHHGHHRHHR